MCTANKSKNISTSHECSVGLLIKQMSLNEKTQLSIQDCIRLTLESITLAGLMLDKTGNQLVKEVTLNMPHIVFLQRNIIISIETIK